MTEPDPRLPLEYQQAAVNMARNHERNESRIWWRSMLVVVVYGIAAAVAYRGLGAPGWVVLAGLPVLAICLVLARLHSWSRSWWAPIFRRGG